MRAACSEKPAARAQRCLWLLRLVLVADAGQANRIGEVGVEMSILVIGAWGLVLLDFLLRNPSETRCESRANHLDVAVNREGAAGEKAVREDRMKMRIQVCDSAETLKLHLSEVGDRASGESGLFGGELLVD